MGAGFFSFAKEENTVKRTQKKNCSSGDLSMMYLIKGWQARAALDGLGAASIERVGQARVLPLERLPEFEAELRRRGWLQAGARSA